LIYKARARAGAIYQQSYPQKPWKTVKAFLNQALTAMFANVSQDYLANYPLFSTH
jgi:hypothetical protein